MTTNTTHRNEQDRLDTAALATATVVAQAMRVRKLTMSEAVVLVADETGAGVEHVEALVARCGLLAAEGAR